MILTEQVRKEVITWSSLKPNNLACTLTISTDNTLACFFDQLDQGWLEDRADSTQAIVWQIDIY